MLETANRKVTQLFFAVGLTNVASHPGQRRIDHETHIAHSSHRPTWLAKIFY